MSIAYSHGDQKVVHAPVLADTVIAVGDLLYLDTDNVKPASSQTDQLSEAANQDLFAGNFLGIAMRASAAGETAPIPVATAGVWRCSCLSATFNLGDKVNSDEASNGTTLQNQVVAAVALPQYAIGRVFQTEPVAVTSVLVEIVSTVMAGGVEGQSYAAP